MVGPAAVFGGGAAAVGVGTANELRKQAYEQIIEDRRVRQIAGLTRKQEAQVLEQAQQRREQRRQAQRGRDADQLAGMLDGEAQPSPETQQDAEAPTDLPEAEQRLIAARTVITGAKHEALALKQAYCRGLGLSFSAAQRWLGVGVR